jgi:hypothetical protein
MVSDHPEAFATEPNAHRATALDLDDVNPVVAHCVA